MREFEQMEMEWFCKAENVTTFFEEWSKSRRAFYTKLGINPTKIRLRAHEKSELAHYSAQTSDIEYEYPFGWKELEGIADRGNFDLTQHSKHSGKDLSVRDEQTNTSYIPHVVECSVGVDRLFLTLLFDAYHVDARGGENRTVLRFNPTVAPIKAAFLPLSKKLSEPMHKLYKDCFREGYQVTFDDSGSIGKRYRRNDEIGTPLCFTYDFDSVEDNCVTVRNRDTLEQKRIALDTVKQYIQNTLSSV
jgi:glycyl-tRNA synthetase